MIASRTESLRMLEIILSRAAGVKELNAYHFDLDKSFIAVVEQVAGLAAVDANDT